MNTTTELILGFGRTLRAIREREGLTQKELAEGMGVSLNQVKKYEQENLEDIGPNGFSIMVFAKLANYLDVHPTRLFDEMASHCAIGTNDAQSDQIQGLLSLASSKSIDALMSARGEASAPFGNHAAWSFEMAAALTKLPAGAKAKVGLEILRELLDAKAVTKEEVTKQMQDLFSFTLKAED